MGSIAMIIYHAARFKEEGSKHDRSGLQVSGFGYQRDGR